MNATTHEARLAGMMVAPEASTESSFQAENALLSELPGIVFGLLTLAYIVTSLIALA
jgi:hypothetical protein